MKKTMMALALCLVSAMFLTGCAQRKVFKATDYFVEQIVENSYSTTSTVETIKSGDVTYFVYRVDDIIDIDIINISKKVTKHDYYALRKKLIKHYDGDMRIHRIFVNEEKSVRIICR